jgi:hypothetical protein
MEYLSNDSAEKNTSRDTSANGTGHESSHNSPEHIGRQLFQDTVDTAVHESAQPQEQNDGGVFINPGQVHEFGVRQISYNDTSFESQLSGDLADDSVREIRLTDFPNDGNIKGWKDEGGYFFFFTDGRDGKTPHHFGKSLQFVQVVRENGQRPPALSIFELKQQIDAATKGG